MSSLTTIQGTDLISGSRTNINNNFSALNTDKIETSTLDTDTTLAANSDSKIATQKAVKAYADSVASPVGKYWNQPQVDASGTDAYAITVPGVTAYAQGQVFTFQAGTANTGACTLNVNGLGANSIFKDGGTITNLVTGDILVNQIVVVEYDGARFQMISQVAGLKDATKLTGIVPIANLPTPAFQQAIPALTQGQSTGVASGSSQDGSIIYSVQKNATELYRYQRDSVTGMYFQTHTVSMTTTIPNGDVGGIIEIGTYIYVFGNNGTNINATRFLAADLTGEQAMTVPTVASTVLTVAWTDGTFAYVISATSATTSRKWSVSGTTFSAVSTATVSSVLANAGNVFATMFDGTNAYVITILSNTDFTIYKITTLDGTVFTTSTKVIQPFSDVVDGGVFIANVDSTRIYIGVQYVIYDEAAAITSQIHLLPISKP